MATKNTMVDFRPAADELKGVLARITDDQLSARTPCVAYRVGDLLDHLMGLTEAFTMAANKSTGAPGGDGQGSPSGPGAPSAAHLDPEWRSRLPLLLDQLVAAWREPAAWTGSTEAGGVTMPAEVMAVVAIDELVIHGWDLARATGRQFSCDPASIEAIVGLLADSDDGDGEGLFGPVVAVPTGAPPLDRAVGLTGRDPAWTP